MTDNRYHDSPGRKVYIVRKNKELRKRRKSQIVELYGGMCSVCGYSKCLDALEFHHRNPIDKLFSINQRTMGRIAWKAVLVEAAKCILLCANCHREIHSLEE